MIHPTTKVQWMDVKTQKVFTDDISKMFQMYSHMAKDGLASSEILFDANSDIVKVTDMYGWTDVKEIIKFKLDPVWVEVNVANHSIKMTNDTYIPIWKPDSPVQGFHGETKYPCRGRNLCDTEETDMVRIRRGKSENNEDIEFSRISIAGAAHDDFVYVYGITTKSGFFNGNNIYLFAKGL